MKKCLYILAALSLVSMSNANQSNLEKISQDDFTNTDAQHATEVDPVQFAFGETIVTAFQVGRFQSVGATSIGWSTSLDGGLTWRHGLIQDLTVDAGGGTWSAVSLPAVTFDLKHHQWLITMMPYDADGNADGLLVSRSFDGLNWSKPATLFATIAGEGTDKYFTACDNNLFSPHFGNCYAAFSDYDPNLGYGNKMSVSRDGGANWSAPIDALDGDGGSVGSVVIQPNGHIVVLGTYGGPNSDQNYAVTSTDGGKTFNPTVTVSIVNFNYPAQGYMRADPFPTAGVGTDGTIYFVNADCSFRTNCSANDLVLSTSKDGVKWSAIQRIPIDSVSSNVDHFIPGLGVRGDLFFGPQHTGLALSYYYLSDATCDPTTSACVLSAGFVSSEDGGKTWNKPSQVAGPMALTSLAFTYAGYMVANEITSIYVNGQPQSAFAIGLPPNAKTGNLDEAIYSAKFHQDF